MRNIWYRNAFHSHSNKTHFQKKGFALGVLIFIENFPRDSWRYSYIQIKGNVTFLCCCFPHLHSCFCEVWESTLSMGWANCRAKDIFSFNVQTKPSSSTQFVSLPFVLYTTLRGLVESLVSGCPSDSKKQTSKPNKLKKKNSSPRAFYEFLLLSYCLGLSAELI